MIHLTWELKELSKGLLTLHTKLCSYFHSLVFPTPCFVFVNLQKCIAHLVNYVHCYSDSFSNNLQESEMRKGQMGRFPIVSFQIGTHSP